MAVRFWAPLLVALVVAGCGDSSINEPDGATGPDLGRPAVVPDDLAMLIVLATSAYELRLERLCVCNVDRCVDLAPALDLEEARCVVSMLDARDDAPVYRYYSALLDYSWDLMECVEASDCDTEGCLTATAVPDALLRRPSGNLDPAIEACVSR